MVRRVARVGALCARRAVGGSFHGGGFHGPDALSPLQLVFNGVTDELGHPPLADQRLDPFQRLL